MNKAYIKLVSEVVKEYLAEESIDDKEKGNGKES